MHMVKTNKRNIIIIIILYLALNNQNEKQTKKRQLSPIWFLLGAVTYIWRATVTVRQCKTSEEKKQTNRSSDISVLNVTRSG